MLALKRQNDSIVQQLAELTVELQKHHQNSFLGESSAGGLRDGANNQYSLGEIHARTMCLEFPPSMERILQARSTR